MCFFFFFFFFWGGGGLLLLFCFVTEKFNCLKPETFRRLHDYCNMIRKRGNWLTGRKKQTNYLPKSTQLLWALRLLFKYNVALRPQRPSRLLGIGSPGRPPRLPYSSGTLVQCCSSSVLLVIGPENILFAGASVQHSARKCYRLWQ